MTTDRFQLELIPVLRANAHPLPPEVRGESIELIAQMLVRLAHDQRKTDVDKEEPDESR